VNPEISFSAVSEIARHMDAADPLAAYRDRFFAAEPELIYMDGNSLGRMPSAASEKLEHVLRYEWGERLIRSWGEEWYTLPQVLGDKIGALLGAAPGQMLVCDSTSINLYKLASAALRLNLGRRKIVTDRFNFPSDVYILQGIASQMGVGHRIELIDSRDGIHIEMDDLLGAIDEDTALVGLSHTVFKSGFLYDMEYVTRQAHRKGAFVLWDLSHSAGAVPAALDDWNVDFAVGCTYKYLNGGPGSPAFLYVRTDLQQQAESPIWGWFGEDSPFAFGLDYKPAPGVRRFLTGTPPILSMQALGSGLDLLEEAGIQEIRRKSIQLTQFMIDLFDAFLAPIGFELGSPREASRRGSHISIRHPQGYRINRALIDEMQVVPDFREPDNIRFGFAPLYTSFFDVVEAVRRTVLVVREERYSKYPPDRSPVT
jgi:kynureninase